MEIEILSAGNIHALAVLVPELWPECIFEEEYEKYSGIINAEDEICYLIKEQEQFAGFVHVAARHDYVEGADDLPVAYVEAIYVKPAYQQQGIATRLIHTAADWARQKGFKQMASDTGLVNNAAINFHKKAGFTEVERVVCFIRNL